MKKKKRKPSTVINGKTKEQRQNATDEQKKEHTLAQWFYHMKIAKQKKRKSRLYPSVEKILIEVLGDKWYENENEENALKIALEYKVFYEEKKTKTINSY